MSIHLGFLFYENFFQVSQRCAFLLIQCPNNHNQIHNHQMPLSLNYPRILVSRIANTLIVFDDDLDPNKEYLYSMMLSMRQHFQQSSIFRCLLSSANYDPRLVNNYVNCVIDHDDDGDDDPFVDVDVSVVAFDVAVVDGDFARVSLYVVSLGVFYLERNLDHSKDSPGRKRLNFLRLMCHVDVMRLCKRHTNCGMSNEDSEVDFHYLNCNFVGFLFVILILLGFQVIHSIDDNCDVMMLKFHWTFLIKNGDDRFVI